MQNSSPVKNYECLLNISNPEHFLSIINDDGTITEIKATKFKFKGELKVKERFVLPNPNRDPKQDEILDSILNSVYYYDHSFEIYETPNFHILLKSINGKDKEYEIIESEKSFFIHILIIPKDFRINFNMLFNFFSYRDLPELQKYLLQLAKNFNIDTEYTLDLDK